MESYQISKMTLSYQVSSYLDWMNNCRLQKTLWSLFKNLFLIFFFLFNRRQCRRSGAFVVNFEHISHLALVFLLLTLNRYLPAEILPFNILHDEVLSHFFNKRGVCQKIVICKDMPVIFYNKVKQMISRMLSSLELLS